MNFMEFYNSEIKKAALQNLDEAMELAQSIIAKNCTNLNDDEKYFYNVKVYNAAARHSLSTDEILAEVSTSRVSAALLAKDPSRMNLAEKTQPLFITMNSNSTVQNLPNGGSKSIAIENGALVSAKTRKSKSSKTIDYIINDNIYTCAKVIRSGGGGQDLAVIDTINYVNEAVKYIRVNGTDKKFAVLIDGDNEINYIKSVNDQIPTDLQDYIFATTTDQFVQKQNSIL